MEIAEDERARGPWSNQPRKCVVVSRASACIFQARCGETKTFILHVTARTLDVFLFCSWAPPRARALGLSVDGSEGPKPEELSCPLPPSRHAEVRQGNQGQSLSEQI